MLFPPHCRICTHKTLKGHHFCSQCQKLFTLLCPISRCPHCFSQADGLCLNCLFDYEMRIVKVAMCWEGCLEVDRLIALIRRGMMSRLATDVLHVQYELLGWPDPDIVVPIPGKAEKGYLRRFAKRIGVPSSDLLYKRPGAFPQGALPYRRRYRMPIGSLAIEPMDLLGKRILLVDDVVGTYETMLAAAHLLRGRGASAVYALVLASEYVID